MTLLMVKYIRREEEEMAYEFYYDEFVKREHFSNLSNDVTYKRMIEARIKSLEDHKSVSLSVASGTDGATTKTSDICDTSSVFMTPTDNANSTSESITLLPPETLTEFDGNCLVETFV